MRSIFKDSSVGNSIEIAIVKLVILKKNPVSIVNMFYILPFEVRQSVRDGMYNILFIVIHK